MSQPFGFIAPGKPWLHDTHQVLREFAERHSLTVPDKDNKSACLSDVAQVLKVAYQQHHSPGQLSSEAIERIGKDAQAYAETGKLPYYLLRRWMEHVHGVDEIRRQMKLSHAT